MTRLDRVIKGFNDYDKLVQELTSLLDERESIIESIVAEQRVNKVREEVSVLIGELKRHGCRRER
jgi:hypothetical protein